LMSKPDIIAYARCSTERQDLNTQAEALKAAGADRVFTEKVFGASEKRPELRKALDAVQPGNVSPVSAVIRVGDGRGFVVETADGVRYVITAAHCLPELPPYIAAAFSCEKTWRLLAPLGEQQAVMAECLFVDPVNDIAILGAPDGQTFSNEDEAYSDLLEAAGILVIGDLVGATERSSTNLTISREPAFILDLDVTRGWQPCVAEVIDDGPIWLDEAISGLKRGMSGSPVLNAAGAAVGVIALVDGTSCGPQARLARDLPGWLLRRAQALSFPRHSSSKVTA
jgi:hypothetical protein